jgi:hypothetical protein
MEFQSERCLKADNCLVGMNSQARIMEALNPALLKSESVETLTSAQCEFGVRPAFPKPH